MATAVDPICQMEVDIDHPPGGHSEYQGTSYYFCAPGCKVAFDQEPEKYLQQGHITPERRASLFSRLFRMR